MRKDNITWLLNAIFEFVKGLVDWWKQPDDAQEITQTVTPTPPLPLPTVEIAKEKENVFLWILDPGHSIHTPGKRHQGFLEYEFNRDVASRLAALLREENIKYAFSLFYYDSIEDDRVSLQKRVERANTLRSDLPKLFVSIHANAQRLRPNQEYGQAHGLETWYCKGSEQGKEFASVLQRSLIERLGWKDRGIKASANLYVLKHTNCPAVLSENGFYTNLLEQQMLKDHNVRQQIAQAHFDAIVYYENLYRTNTRIL